MNNRPLLLNFEQHMVLVSAFKEIDNTLLHHLDHFHKRLIVLIHVLYFLHRVLTAVPIVGYNRADPVNHFEEAEVLED